MSDKLVVLAKNRAEMVEAQTQSVGWALNKLQETQANISEAQENLDLAQVNGWKTRGWLNVRRREVKRRDYYEKIHAALNAGYVIIPNFPIDVFAIRTNRTYPLKHYSENWSQDRTQKSEVLPLGEGEHFDSVPEQRQHEIQNRYLPGRTPDAPGSTMHYWASNLQNVDFPIKAVKPAILEETSKALMLKIFDEVGCNPGRPGWNPGTGLNRKADPMVVGRIIYKTSGWSENKAVSFLITWWLDFKDIQV